MNRVSPGPSLAILLQGIVLIGLSAVARADVPERPEVRKSPAYARAFRQGELERMRGDFESSIIRFNEALTISRQASDPAAEAACLVKVGLLEWNMGRVREAEGNFSDAVLKAGVSGQNDVLNYSRAALEIIRLYNAGKDFRLSNALQRSLAAFAEAIALGRKNKSEEFVVKCLRQMSLTYWQMNDLTSFLSNNEEALEIATRLNLKIERGRCLNNLGVHFWKSMDYSKGLQYFQPALRLSKELKDAQMEAECLSNVGIIYTELGDHVAALDYLNSALVIDRKLGNRTAISIDLTNIGSVYRDQANYLNSPFDLSKALACYQECLRYLETNQVQQIRITCLNNIGTIKTDLGMFADAIDVLKTALKETDSTSLNEEKASLNTNLGEAYLKQLNIKVASDHFLKAVSIAKKMRLNRILWESYYGLGQCLEKMGDPFKALGYYQKSMDVIDAIRSRILLETFKTGFARNKLGIFESVMNLLFWLSNEDPAGSRLEEMFVIVEKAKARAFLECLGEARIDFRAGLTPGLKEREEAVSKEISALILELSNPSLKRAERGEKLVELGRAEAESFRLISEMKAEQPGLAGLVSPELFSIQRLQADFLDGKTGLIEYFLGDARSYMFFITRSGAKLFVLPPREAIERSVRGYLKALSNPDGRGFSGMLAAERIAGELLPPLAGLPAEDLKRLIIIPDGVLYYLPFETLRPASPPASGFLIEQFEISYAPSCSSLVFLSRKAAGHWSKTLLALGAPSLARAGATHTDWRAPQEWTVGEIYKGQGFDLSPLPFSKKEVLDIAGHFRKGARDVLLGVRATEQSLKDLALEDYRIVHFACHGLLDEKVPFRSALILSAGSDDGEDGILQAREIYNMRLDADLVVLSACQTGRGGLERGEGLLGLPRMFFYAGSKSVISTLWPIGDRSTALFMDGFYEYLAQGQGKAAALKLAKVRMLRSKYSHPFHWAAFILNGDFGPTSRPEERKPGKASMGQRSKEKTSNLDSPNFPSESRASTDQ